MSNYLSDQEKEELAKRLEAIDKLRNFRLTEPNKWTRRLDDELHALKQFDPAAISSLIEENAAINESQRISSERVNELESALEKMHDLLSGDTRFERGYAFYSWQRVYHLINETKKDVDAAEAERDKLRLILACVLKQPYGCPFCDSGKLRTPDNPKKGHDDDCGFALAEAALKNEAGKI